MAKKSLRRLSGWIFWNSLLMSRICRASSSLVASARIVKPDRICPAS